MPRLDVILMLFALASPLAADPLSDMTGEWAGSGIARETPDSPEETVRCRLDNEWQADRNRLRVRGRCAVPGRTFDIDGALVATPDGALSGFWGNPDGPGQTPISGQTRDNTVYFTFRAKHTKTGADLSQVISLTVDGPRLELVSTSRGDQTQMARIAFAR